jgi:hypothetical protein
VNDARALRVVEIINDFRTLHIHISQLKSDPPIGEENEGGYLLMNECFVQAQQLLAAEFSIESVQGLGGNGDGERIQLQRYDISSSLDKLASGIITDFSSQNNPRRQLSPLPGAQDLSKNGSRQAMGNEPDTNPPGTEAGSKPFGGSRCDRQKFARRESSPSYNFCSCSEYGANLIRHPGPGVNHR